MPNHVTTICTVSGETDALARFRAVLFPEIGANDEEQPDLFDFGKVVPAPDSIKATESSSVAEIGAQLLLLSTANPFASETGGVMHWNRIAADVPEAGPSPKRIAAAYLAKHPEYAEKGRAVLRALVETGHRDWYDWNIANWGTKWSAYGVEVVDDGESFRFKFETAWSFPEPIFEALLGQFPGLTFDCITFDEGWNFAGKGQYGAAVVEPFAICDATDELFEAVYGHAPIRDEEDEE